MNRHCTGFFLLFCLLSLQSPAQTPDPARESLAHAALGLQTLQGWYAQETGLWRTTNWWNAANAVTVIANYSRLSGDSQYLPALENTYEHNAAKDFRNEYYDDEGWWALAWVRAYEVSHDTRYLAAAERIFADMAGGWDNTCGGGIWWRKDKHYKNAIANELFLSVAANLANLTQGDERRTRYRSWAEREWQWFAATGMINSDGLINDGLDSACHNNRRNPWSYNQGVILGGLTRLAGETGDHALLDRAASIASAAISKLTDANGILHDRCEPRCGADAVQFKGIFARNLAILNTALPDTRFLTFLEVNAASIWQNRDPENRFGVVWSAAASPADAATQVSALDAILAAAEAARGH